MKPAHVEIEAKLIAADPGVLRLLPDVLKTHCPSVKDRGSATIRDTYYDTAGWRMYRAGFACRVRRTGRQSMLVLKSLRRPKGGVSEREEYEQKLTLPPSRFLRKLSGPLGRKVATIIAGEALKPLFAVRNKRRTYETRCKGGLVAEVCADDFKVSSAGKSRELAEVEIEVVRGKRAQLQKLAKLLSTRLKLRSGSRAKFQQGLLVGGHRPPRMR